MQYEEYWTSIQNEPDKPAWITGAAPTPAEIEWARFAAQTPHYVLSSARTTASLIDAGLVDELRLIVYPLLAGAGKSLFATTERRGGLELWEVRQLQGGRVCLTYGTSPFDIAAITPR